MQGTPRWLRTRELLFVLLQLIQTFSPSVSSHCHRAGVPRDSVVRTSSTSQCSPHKPRTVPLIKRGLWYPLGGTSEFLSPWCSTPRALSRVLCTLDTKAGWKIAASTPLSSTFLWPATSCSWSHMLLLSNTWHITWNISLREEGWTSAR